MAGKSRSVIKRNSITTKTNSPNTKTVTKMPNGTTVEIKLTPTQMRNRIVELEELIESLQHNYAYCNMCDELKKKDLFYINSDSRMKGHTTPICKQCAYDIALQKDKQGNYHEPTKESIIQALQYLDKPFLECLYGASVEESRNSQYGVKTMNVWSCYIKNVAMPNYIGLRFQDSDMFKVRNVVDENQDPNELIKANIGQDLYFDYKKNKNDVIRLLGYDPFAKEAIADQPFLYSQLLGLLDKEEQANDDMMRTASCISIVRGFLQHSKIDDAIADLTGNIAELQKNSGIIKSLQDSKNKATSVIKDLAAESCISLKNNKQAKKGENTWTGKIKKIKELNLREGEVNGFDIRTCRGMQQVQEISDASIMKQLALDDSEWSDMVAEMRVDNGKLRKERDAYKEINRLLLKENLDLKDYMEEQDIDISINVQNLKELYSVFSQQDDDSEDIKNE